MLTGPHDTAYAAALIGPHRRVARLDVTDIDGNERATDVRISTGSVTANLTNRVTRSADFTLPAEWFPRTPADPLSPYAAVVHIRAGLALGTGLEITYPVFTGRVYDARRDPGGRVSFRADDLAADVVAARFEQPQASTRSSVFANQSTEARRLITQALPQAQYGTDDIEPTRIPALVWDEDRGQALDDIAASAGARWFALGDGRFVLRRYAYEPSAPVVEFLDGPQGLMSQAAISITRDGTANSVVVVSERMDGTDPVRVVSRDVASGSPTRYGGLFGRVVQVIQVQTPLTQTEAQTLARTQLTAAVGLSEQWECDVVADHRVEPGDTARLRYRGVQADQIIDGITYPLDTRPMRLLTRGTVQLDIPGT
jgi:hypothetical protein